MSDVQYLGNGYQDNSQTGLCPVEGCALDAGCGLNACGGAACGANICGLDGCTVAGCVVNACPVNGCAPADGCVLNFTPLPGPFEAGAEN